MTGTEGPEYTSRLERRGERRWKRLLDVQRPYRWNLRRHNLGRTLDIGCGIGRNLATLAPGSLGVDHNPTSVQAAVERGLRAITLEQWRSEADNWTCKFDSLLLAHLVEHLTRGEAVDLLMDYLPALRPGGKVMFICPQERGYASDATHVSWTSGSDLAELASTVGLEPGPWQSFPLPRAFGKWFTYNEFTLLAVKPLAKATSRDDGPS